MAYKIGIEIRKVKGGYQIAAGVETGPEAYDEATVKQAVATSPGQVIIRARQLAKDVLANLLPVLEKEAEK